MKTVFVDANVFLRFTAKDDGFQHEKAVGLFRKAALGHVALVTGPPVLFEVFWTLRSAYRQPTQKVLDYLSSILSLPGLQMTDSIVVEEAISLAREKRQEFADAYIAVSARSIGAAKIASFDRKDFQALGAVLYPL